MGLDLTPNEFVGYRIKPDLRNYTVGTVRRYGPQHKNAGQEYFTPMAYCKDVPIAAEMLFHFALRTRGETAQNEQALLDKSCADMTAFRNQVDAAKRDVLLAVDELNTRLKELQLDATKLAKIFGAPLAPEDSDEPLEG